MAQEKFIKWLNENMPNIGRFTLNEGTGSIPGTKGKLEANAKYLNQIADAVGINGKIPTETEASEILMAGKADDIPVFFKDTNGTLNVTRSKVDSVASALTKNGMNCEVLKDELLIKFEDGQSTSIRFTSKSVSKKSHGEETIVGKYFTSQNFVTAVQESVTAGILQLMASKHKIREVTLPDFIKNMIGGDKAEKKLSNFQKWLLASNPATDEGICRYIDCGVNPADAEQWQREWVSFLINGQSASDRWITAFNNLYNSSILGEIASVFKNGVSNWSAARFMHFFTKTGDKTYHGSWLENYLVNDRCGMQKDTVDKTDIILCFNETKAKQAVAELFAQDDRQEYFRLMNQFINDKDFIGISLKKVGSSVNLSAVNFKTGSTAIGQNIADEKKICLKFEDVGSKNNTFDIKNAKIANPSLTDDKGKYKVSYIIQIKFNKGHGHDIHQGDDDILNINVRSGNSSHKSVVIEGAITNAKAQLGKMGTFVKDVLKYDATADYTRRVDARSTPEEVAAAYLAVAKNFLALIKANEEGFYRILAGGIAYPVQLGKAEDDNFIIESAPYIKIY